MEENKEDIYIIGFPKSGNTWLTRLIAEVTNSNITVVDDKDILHKVENSDDRVGKYQIHKIHYTQDMPRVLKAKKVYIVRDPRDTFVSGFFNNYRVIKEDLILQNSIVKKFFDYEVQGISKVWRGDVWSRFKRYIYLFLKTISFSPKRAHVGNWSEHLIYWTSLDDIVIVKYEDLLENTQEELKKILQKLDINVTEEKLKQTIENQSFAKKKKAFIEKGDTKNASFMRSGKKESWRKLVDKKLQNIIEADHKEMMRKFNYKMDIQ